MRDRRSKWAFPLCALDVDVNPLMVARAFGKLVNPRLIHEEPTRYSDFASDPFLNIRKREFAHPYPPLHVLIIELAFNAPKAELSALSVSLSEGSLVEFADAGPFELIDKKYCLRHAVFRNNSLVRARPEERFEVVFSQGFGELPVADDEGQRSLAPFFVLDPDDGHFLHPRRLHDNVLDVQSRNPFASGLDQILHPIRDLQVTV